MSNETKNKKKELKVKIDVMVTLPDGTMTFQTIEVSKDNIQELLNTTKDPVARHNLEKELKSKKIKF